jgi:hypothetical protein
MWLSLGANYAWKSSLQPLSGLKLSTEETRQYKTLMFLYKIRKVQQNVSPSLSFSLTFLFPDFVLSFHKFWEILIGTYISSFLSEGGLLGISYFEIIPHSWLLVGHYNPDWGIYFVCSDFPDMFGQ